MTVCKVHVLITLPHKILSESYIKKNYNFNLVFTMKIYTLKAQPHPAELSKEVEHLHVHVNVHCQSRLAINASCNMSLSLCSYLIHPWL